MFLRYRLHCTWLRRHNSLHLATLIIASTWNTLNIKWTKTYWTIECVSSRISQLHRRKLCGECAWSMDSLPWKCQQVKRSSTVFCKQNTPRSHLISLNQSTCEKKPIVRRTHNPCSAIAHESLVNAVGLISKSRVQWSLNTACTNTCPCNHTRNSLYVQLGSSLHPIN